LISILGAFSPGIIIDYIIKDFFMHKKELNYMELAKLIKYCVCYSTQTGLDPSLASTSLIFQGLDVKSGYSSSNSFHAFASSGCLKICSFV